MFVVTFWLMAGMVAVSSWAVPDGSAPVVRVEDVFAAIRANDLPRLRQLVSTPGTANAETPLHWSSLHYAALYGSPAAMRILLEAGANPNATNQQGDAPLVYAAWSPERTGLLVSRGAQVNPKDQHRVSALQVASAVPGNAETVRYLLERGADPKQVDAFDDTPLHRCADSGDADSLAALLAKGAEPQCVTKANMNGVWFAAAKSGSKAVAMLLQANADPDIANYSFKRVKNGPIALFGLTPLMNAAPYAETSTIALLLKSGAKVNALDSRKMSPLMLAIATDQANPAVIQQLIDAGADVHITDQNGESALDWAEKFNQPAILEILYKAHASGSKKKAAPIPPAGSQPRTADEAIARSLPLLVRSGPEFFKEGGGCSGCHHQPAYARVYASLAEAGAANNEMLRRNFLESMVAVRAHDQPALPYLMNQGGKYDPALASLMGYADLHEPPNPYTDLLVHYLAVSQDIRGFWDHFGTARPPIEDSRISRTAMGIRALTVYSWPARHSELQERVLHAKRWLQTSQPVTIYEEADRIAGLSYAGVSPEDLQDEAVHLLASQRADGGWPQTPYLESDAYATGLVLHTLRSSGLLQTTAPAYKNGAAFLLRTQFPDGSWYVRSRAPKFQPYFQSGFPFEHDQWISSTGTAYALMALAPLHRSSPLTARNSDLQKQFAAVHPPEHQPVNSKHGAAK